MAIYSYEYTDTFGGERNYCWVKRGKVEAKDIRHAMRRARAAIGATGCRGDLEDIGGSLSWTPRGMCCVLDVDYCCDTWAETEDERVPGQPR